MIFFLSKKQKHYLYVNVFAEKKKAVKKKTKHEKHTQFHGISTLNLSRDDPACINLCITYYKYLKVLNLSFDKKKIILPFLTAAQRKLVQIHVMKTCRQTSVTNSLLTLNFLYFYKCQHNSEWIKILCACSKPRLHRVTSQVLR